MNFNTVWLLKVIIVSRPERYPKRAQKMSHLDGYYPVSSKYCAF
jgi:hypothetical protein